MDISCKTHSSWKQYCYGKNITNKILNVQHRSNISAWQKAFRKVVQNNPQITLKKRLTQRTQGKLTTTKPGKQRGMDKKEAS